MNSSFNVGYTNDFLGKDGQLQFKTIGKEILDELGGRIRTSFLARPASPMSPDLLRDLDAVVSLTPRYTADSFAGLERLVAIVRFGVGYDMVDVLACTQADVALCITAGAVNHSVAEATVGWMLQLGHKAVAKDRLVREGRWSERDRYMGGELRHRTLGIIGLGGIGLKLSELARAFGMQPILAFDPYANEQRAREAGVELVPLDRLMCESDYISVNCPLTDETRNLVGARELGLMKSTSYLVNTSRGGIVNEPALILTLEQRKISGAAIDVYAQEPVDASTPFAKLDNVILAPHCIAWTDDLFTEIGQTASRCVLDLAAGKIPRGLVNRDVLERPGFQKKVAAQNSGGQYAPTQDQGGVLK
jgi:phosphoglycerate dehydrogenase-like enzyme